VIKISLVKPILNDIDTFDSQNSKTITFTVNSGDQIYANTLEIQNNLDSTVIFSEKTVVPYFSLNHTIPASTLVNGNTYKAKIQTFNSNGDASVWSDWVLFMCYADVIIDITNVTSGGAIANQSYTFLGSYSQAQSDLLQSYKFILYDSSNIEIGDSGLLYDGSLSYEFIGLINEANYTIELQTTTQHNVTTSISKSFTVSYIPPSFSSLITLTNNTNSASINVQIEALRILGQTTGTTSIENSTWGNCLNGGKFYFDSTHGFTLPKGDWTIQLWLKGLVDSKTVVNSIYQGTLITTLYGQNNVKFEIQYYDGCFHLYKYISNILFSHYVSNVISASVDNSVYLFCQSINGRINLQCEIPGISGYGVSGFGILGYGM